MGNSSSSLGVSQSATNKSSTLLHTSTKISEVSASYFGKIDTASTVAVVQQGAKNLLFGGTGFPVTGGSTVYIGTIVDTAETTARIAVPALNMFELRVSCSTAPGSSKSFTYTVMKNGVAQDGSGGTTDLSATISGASDTSGYKTLTTSIAFSGGDQFSVRVVAAAGAATAYHTYSIKLVS